MDVEIIEFIRPDGPQHNLYITSITKQLEYDKLYEYLDAKFSPFGAVYEIQIVETKEAAPPEHHITANTMNTAASTELPGPNVPTGMTGGYYAFVKFYSMKAAAKAKKELTARLFIGGQHMRIRYSTRQAPEEPVPLYYTKCFELVNHYLGFNGWSLSIIMCKENKEHQTIQPDQVQYVSGVKLDISHHGVTSEGYGVATTSHSLTDPCSKSVAICRAKKQSYQQAVQNAFSRVLLVVLANGKVYVEVNSTTEDRIYCDEQLTQDNLLEVNEVDVHPALEEDDDFDDTGDMDLLNQQLLEDLEAENS